MYQSEQTCIKRFRERAKCEHDKLNYVNLKKQINVINIPTLGKKNATLKCKIRSLITLDTYKLIQDS